jgi:hypothetical protein
MEGTKLQKFKKSFISNMAMSTETNLTHGYELRCMCSRILASVAVIEFHTVEAYSSFVELALSTISVRYEV